MTEQYFLTNCSSDPGLCLRKSIFEQPCVFVSSSEDTLLKLRILQLQKSVLGGNGVMDDISNSNNKIKSIPMRSLLDLKTSTKFAPFLRSSSDHDFNILILYKESF